MVEQPGSVVGRGDDPAGSKNASSERPKPENRPKTATNGPKTPIFGPEEAKTTIYAKNTKNERFCHRVYQAGGMGRREGPRGREMGF